MKKEPVINSSNGVLGLKPSLVEVALAASKAPRRRSVQKGLAAVIRTCRFREAFSTTHFTLTVRPKINDHTDQVIYRWVGPLIEKGRHQGTQWIYQQPDFDAAMGKGPGERFQRPFPRKAYEAKYDVEYLQDRNRCDSTVEVLGQEVPEDLRPEETVDAGADLIC